MSRIFDATAENFSELVVEAPAGACVLVDFWAPWCNPCQQLKPLLERLTGEYDFTLVKVNTEEEQAIAAQMGIRGIPDVRLYRDGRELDRFSGALPEAEVRAFLEKYLPSQLDTLLAEAQGLADGGDAQGATECFNRILADNPQSGKAKLAAAQFLLQRGMGDEATTVLQAITPGDAEYDSAQAMLAMGAFRQACATLEQAQGLDRLYAEAACAAISQEYERALDTFLEVVKQDKGYKEGAARKAMVTLFDALGRDNPLVQTYQRRLAMYLN